MVVLHIYRALVIFPLFCDHQDTESESREMENGVAGPKYHRKKHQSLYGTTISILYKMAGNIVVILHIFELETFPCYFVINKTLNQSHKE